MKKERIFYLDFIRMIATLAIVIIHYNAEYTFIETPLYDKTVFFYTAGGIYLGDWGVSLFFIISGASLMYVYQNRLAVKEFWKKRFLNIYPMFWMAYIIAFCALSFVNRSMYGKGVPLPRLILTVLGFDGLFASETATFYILGEWFLGVIILMYIIFPLLRKLLNEHPIILISIVTVIYFLFAAFYDLTFAPAKIILVRLPEIVFGMCMIKYGIKIKGSAALFATCVIAVNMLVNPELSSILKTTYIGIASFIVLVYLSDFIGKCKPLVKFSGVISKYSYAIFLTHHVIISEVMKRIDKPNVSRIESYGLFFGICILIAIASFLLYKLHNAAMKVFRQKPKKSK